MCYNIREGLYTSSRGQRTVDMKEMTKVAGSLELVQTMFKMASRLQQCYLTDEEIAMYKAVAIMQRGGACLMKRIPQNLGLGLGL